MRLYLIRHAESANNLVHGTEDAVRCYQTDPEITGDGHRQGALLGEHMASLGSEPRQHPNQKDHQGHYALTHLYCSLMTRSLLTAGYVAKSCALDLQALDHVHEKMGLYRYEDNGEMVGAEGPARPYFEQRFPHVRLPEWVGETGWWNRPVEPDDEFIHRVSESYREIVALHGNTDHNVALVTHSDYIDQLLNEITGTVRKPHNYASHWESNWVTHNTSITRVDFLDGSANIVYLNRIDHLPAELVSW